VDHVNTEDPSVVYNPAAPADRATHVLQCEPDVSVPGLHVPEYAIGAGDLGRRQDLHAVPAGESPHARPASC